MKPMNNLQTQVNDLKKAFTKKYQWITFSLLLVIVIMLCSSCASPLTPHAKPTPTPISTPTVVHGITDIDKFSEPSPTGDHVIESTPLPTLTTTATKGNITTTQHWNVTLEKHSALENPENYMIYNPQASVLWPGNLVQGKSLAGGVPDSVPIEERRDGAVTLAIVSGDATGSVNKFSRTFKPALSNVTQAMNEILSGYKGGTAAKYYYSRQDVYSSSQLAFSLNAGYTSPSIKANLGLGLDFQEEKSRVCVKLYQEYFTMCFDDPEGFAGVFPAGFDLNRLSPYVGPGNPLCFISSVTYGRMYILVYESTASMMDLKAALDFAYNGGGASADLQAKANYEQIMSQTSVKLMQIGGDPVAGLQTANAKNLDAINDFMTKGANFSPQNVGAPLSYTVKYLNDCTLARMSNTMEYTIKQMTPAEPSSKFRFTLKGIRCDYNQEWDYSEYYGDNAVELFINNTKVWNYKLDERQNWWSTGKELSINDQEYTTEPIEDNTDNIIEVKVNFYDDNVWLIHSNEDAWGGHFIFRYLYDDNTKSWNWEKEENKNGELSFGFEDSERHTNNASVIVQVDRIQI